MELATWMEQAQTTNENFASEQLDSEDILDIAVNSSIDGVLIDNGFLDLVTALNLDNSQPNAPKDTTLVSVLKTGNEESDSEETASTGTRIPGGSAGVAL